MMRQLANFIKLTRILTEVKGQFINFVPNRGLKFQTDVKWVIPVRKPEHHPSNTGDLASMEKYSGDTIKYPFNKSKELQTASTEVKKIFSLQYQIPSFSYYIYEKQLVDKVKRHPLDQNSLEANIAKVTAKIRFFQPIVATPPNKRKLNQKLHVLIGERQKLLNILRRRDYKKFEWLLEQLELIYKPTVFPNQTVTRKKSLALLAKLRVAKANEEKLGKLKEELDNQKVPFLEKKLEKLKWIMEMEKKNNFSPTITDADIEECIKKIEQVKIEVAERKKNGYIRKIHPYTLEHFDDVLLREKENS